MFAYLKIIDMKQIFLILLLAISTLEIAFPYSSGNRKEEKEKIDLSKDNSDKGHMPERTSSFVNAYIYSSSYIVEVELFNIGTTTVTITNSYGDIVCSTSANTSLPVVLNLAIPSEGSYFIEISSASWYASGSFSL